MYWYKNPLVEQYPIRIRLVTIGVIAGFALFAWIFPRTIDSSEKSPGSGKNTIDEFVPPPITEQV